MPQQKASSSSSLKKTGGEEGTAPAVSRKRNRSPPYPPIVSDYRPYSSGMLHRLYYERQRDDHKGHWDVYYRNNTINGYKDRHYILREFVELRDAITNSEKPAEGEEASRAGPSPSSSAPSFSWMEAGCGVGNAMLPIFEEHGHLPQWRQLLGFDISSVAIKHLEDKKSSLPPALQEKFHVCALDPCKQEVLDCPFFVKGDQGALANPVDFVSMIFVLCSIPVPLHKQVLQRIAACMAPNGGVFFFRDYAVSDHAQTRFKEKEECVRDADSNSYARSNGTLSHFFSVEEVEALFVSVGFTVLDLRVVDREVVNRKSEVAFSRKFVQGRFRWGEKKQE